MRRFARGCQSMSLQPLEDRKLLSGVCELPTDAPPEPARAALSLTTLATSPYVKIKGTYAGSVTSNTFGSYDFNVTITKFTHTGHFSGTGTITILGQDYTGSFIGRVTTKRHVIVTFSGEGITGSIDGKASHTGGSIKGTYQLSGAINDS